MNSRLAVIVVAACAACSGPHAPDPCVAATSGFSLHGSRFPEGIELTWTGDANATYEVWGFGPKHEDEFQNPVATVTGTSAAISMPAGLGTVQIEVRPMVGTAVCATTAQALTVPAAPSLTATTTSSGVQLQWTADPLYGPDAALARGLDANTLEPVGDASGGEYLDSGGASGTAYDYVVELHATNLDGFSDPVTAHSLVDAPVVTVLPHPSNIELHWQNPAGALLCSVAQDSPGPARVIRTDITFGGAVVDCPVGTSCTYRVFCHDVVSQDGRPAIVTSLASSAAASFFDPSAPLFQPARYRVVSVASDGLSDPAAFCGTAPAMAVKAPDAMNVAASTGTAPDFQYPGQTFTVAHGGQLMGIEVARALDTPTCLFVSAEGDPQADFRPVCASETVISLGSALAPDQIQGVYYDLSLSST